MTNFNNICRKLRLNSKSTSGFVSGKVADSTIILAVIVPCITALLIVIAVLFYCYKVKNRYRNASGISKILWNCVSD